MERRAAVDSFNALPVRVGIDYSLRDAFPSTIPTASRPLHTRAITDATGLVKPIRTAERPHDSNHYLREGTYRPRTVEQSRCIRTEHSNKTR